MEIVTWHGSKGREWPITVVAEFDHDIEEWPGSTANRLEALDKIDDMAVVLASAALIHTPGFSAPEAERRFIEDRRETFEANAKNLLYVALTRARDRLVLEWPEFLKKRDPEAPEAKRLFHVFEDACAPQIGDSMLRIGGVDCPALITPLPDQASITEYVAGVERNVPRFGDAEPLPSTPTSPWRLQPSQLATAEPTPESDEINLGEPWPPAVSTAARGTALHLAMRTYLTRPELIEALPAATGLDETTLGQVAERAKALKDWLSDNGYTDLQCEIPMLRQTPEGAEVHGTIDLLAIGPKGCLLIDHKSGGAGSGLGDYWPQLAAYGGLVREAYPSHELNGMAVLWVDHGRLDLVGMPSAHTH